MAPADIRGANPGEKWILLRFTDPWGGTTDIFQLANVGSNKPWYEEHLRLMKRCCTGPSEPVCCLVTPLKLQISQKSGNITDINDPLYTHSGDKASE
jgi:hypothetical protein